MKTRILSLDDVRQIVQRVGLDSLMDQTIDRMAGSLRDFDPDVTRIKVRDGFAYATPGVGLLEWMPVLEPGGRATVKMVGYHPRNPTARSIPTILSTVTRFDTETGHLLGVVDGTFLTALRTGAASALASRSLARPDSKVLGLIGCGAQAVTQVHGLSRAFGLETVLAHDIDPARLETLRERIASCIERSPNVETASTERILREADILCTQTSVEVKGGPVFADGAHRPHLHLNAVGSDFPGKTEVPVSMLERAFVCPDFLEQAVTEGECQQIPRERIGPSLDQVLKAPEAFRFAQERLSVFDSTGFALEDAVVAALLFDIADAHALGRWVEIESMAADPWNPYGFLQPSAVRD